MSLSWKEWIQYLCMKISLYNKQLQKPMKKKKALVSIILQSPNTER